MLVGVRELCNFKEALRAARVGTQVCELSVQVFLERLGLSPRTHTKEGEACVSYRLPHLIAATPLAAMLEAYLELVRNASFHEVVEGDVSACSVNCIFYSFHGDTLPALAAHSTFSLLDSKWIGYHGILSYFGSFGLASRRRPCFRFSVDSAIRPKKQIEKALMSEPDRRFYIFTDSGKPYGRVRESLVDLAIESGRPLVPLRHIAEKRRLVNGHQVPLPGTEVRTFVGQEISHARLKKLKSAERVHLLQGEIDRLLGGQETSCTRNDQHKNL